MCTCIRLFFFASVYLLSKSAAIVIDCQNFCPFSTNYGTYQINVRTAKFLNKFLSSINSACYLKIAHRLVLRIYILHNGNAEGSVPDLCHAASAYETFVRM